ncbi:TlpA family protein disulfide reductase [Clostridium aciditolerans]|uniref:Redoxin domain-containing protein n=1 Tax=Clostridium aciditolerans TaxID=339861 RepID=A0A934HUG7_9CLOT|nr:redoxin domain-containing protein [Clostridium aciditolerans]MBI6871088.1 redoxin domain-containing protein [Clostridium aciditolerans]
MKKGILALLIVLILGVAVYEVKNFNSDINSNLSTKQKSQNPSDSTTNQPDPSVVINPTSVKVKAPNFKLKDLNGKEVSLSDLKGKGVFLNFWATWCPPCRGEMPDIQKLYEENKNSDFIIIAINIGEDKDTVKSFIDSNGYKFQILLDSDQSTASKYSITGIPASFFIDKNGNIIYKKTGAMTLDEMKAYIKALNK